MAKDRAFDIRVDGLREFNRELGRVAPDLKPAVKQANIDAANAIVKLAQTRADALGGVYRKTAAKLRATKTQGYAAVALGGKSQPYAYGAEFGAKQYKQFGSWRGNQWDSDSWNGGPGYFLHPAIRDEGQKVIDAYDKALNDILKRAFDN